MLGVTAFAASLTGLRKMSTPASVTILAGLTTSPVTILTGLVTKPQDESKIIATPPDNLLKTRLNTTSYDNTFAPFAQMIIHPLVSSWTSSSLLCP